MDISSENAKYFDGRSATAKFVTAVFSKTNLTITSNETGENEAFSLDTIHAIQPLQPNCELRLALGRYPRRLLVIEDIDEVSFTQLLNNHPKLFQPVKISQKLRRKINNLAIVAWCLAAFVIFGWPNVTASLTSLISYEREKAIGSEILKQVLRVEDELPRSNTPEAAKKSIIEIQILARNLAKAAGIKDYVDIYISVLGRENAYAIPGNNIILYCGLIENLDADEAVFVIAHELSHVKNRHVMQGLVQKMGTQAIFGGVTSGTFGGAALANQLDTLAFTRSMETKSDKEGAELLVKLGYKTDGARGVFEKFEKIGHGYNFKIDELFASHPDPKNRAAAMAKYKSNTNSITPLNIANYNALKNHCKSPYTD